MNRVILMGRPTRDPDIRESGLKVARFTLAVDRIKDGTDFISCVAFGQTAEFIEKYIKQGSKIIGEGRIQTGSYTKNTGERVYTTDVVLERVEFAEFKKKTEDYTDIGADSLDDDDFPFR